MKPTGKYELTERNVLTAIHNPESMTGEKFDGDGYMSIDMIGYVLGFDYFSGAHEKSIPWIASICHRLKDAKLLEKEDIPTPTGLVTGYKITENGIKKLSESNEDNWTLHSKN
jgi:hypothetical protein